MPSREQGFDTLKSIAGDLLLSSFCEYNNNRSILTFKCIDCDLVFKTTNFLYQKSGDGKRCIECKHKNIVTNPSTRDLFIQRCIEKHGGYYSYDFIPDTFKKKDKITIVCPKHGEILTTGDGHLQKGHGCAKCKIDYITSFTRSSTTEFTIKANQVHKFKYNYTNVNYINAVTNVEILCPKHGSFFQSPDSHLRGSNCPRCVSSKPVQSIISMLQRESIIFTTEKTFKGCVGVSGKRLRFDIFIPEYALCVEYDGIHHYQPVLYNGCSQKQANISFHKQQKNDEIKNIFCDQNNLTLVRIPYMDPNPDTTLRKFLLLCDKRRFQYSWKDLSEDIENLCTYIKSFGYDKFAVYGIQRGGLPFAVPISYHFEDQCELGIVQYQRYDGDDKNVKFYLNHKTRNIPIFIIDDLISSGTTMKKVISALQHKYKSAQIHPVVIFGEENTQDIFFMRQHPRKWIQFPYE